MVSAYIARIKQVNAVVNAVTEELFDQAMREADAADKELNTAHEVQMRIVCALQFSFDKYNTLYGHK